MSVLAGMVLGLVAGFIASKIVNKSGEGVFLGYRFGHRWRDCGRLGFHRVWRFLA